MIDVAALGGKRLFITGISGFVGNGLARMALDKGAEVGGVVRSKHTSWRLHSIEKKLALWEGDLSDVQFVKGVLRDFQPDYVFHCAMPSHETLNNNSDILKQQNMVVNHLESLFAAMTELLKPPSALVHACSSMLYKRNNGIITESTPFEPVSKRGKVKLTQLECLLRLAENSSIPVRIGRIFRAYGPWEGNNKLIGSVLKKWEKQEPLTLSSPKFKRNYVYIEDLAEAMFKLALCEGSGLPVVNIAGGATYSAHEIVGVLENIAGSAFQINDRDLPQNEYDIGQYEVDIQKAKEVLEWAPKTSIDKGLRETVNWFLTSK